MSSSVKNPSDNENEVCRVCRGDEQPLFSPCDCNSFVHQECLVDWVKSKHSATALVDYDNIACEVCHSKMHFLRAYDSQAQAGVFDIIKVNAKLFQKTLLTSVPSLLLSMIVLLELVGVFIIRKFLLTDQLPSRNIFDYIFDETSKFFLTDLKIMGGYMLCVFFACLYVNDNQATRKIINYHLKTGEDEEIPNLCLTPGFFSLITILLAFPFLYITLGVVPVRLIKTFDTRFESSSAFIIFHIIISFLTSLVPLPLFENTKPKTFARIFYLKYINKAMFLYCSKHLLTMTVTRECIGYFFGKELLGKDAFIVNWYDISLFQLMFNDFNTLQEITLKIFSFFNSGFYRGGVYYTAMGITEDLNEPSDHFYVLNTFSNLLLKLRNCVFLTGASLLLLGPGMAMLANYKPELLPLTFGYKALESKTPGISLEFLKSNIPNLIDLCCFPLTSFTISYYRPMARRLASALRLSHYLFDEAKVVERGHIVYRNLFDYFFNFERAQLSNPDLFSHPKSFTEVDNLFENNKSIDAYYVPDGQYMRVPGKFNRDITEKYFIPVTSKDELIGKEIASFNNEYTQFRRFSINSHSTIYIPPHFTERLFLYHVLLGTIHCLTTLYFLFSSIHIGGFCTKLLMRFPVLSNKLSTHKFSFLNIFIGAFIQLLSFNALFKKDFKEVAVVLNKVFRIFRNPFCGYITLYPGVFLSFGSAGFISYVSTSLYTLVYKTLYQQNSISGNFALSYFGFPFYLFANHIFIYVVPVMALNLWIIGKLLLKISNDDLDFVQCVKLIWSSMYGVYFKIFFTYFAPALFAQWCVVGYKDYAFHQLNFTAMSMSMRVTFFEYNHSYAHYLFILLGPLNFFGLLAYNYVPVIINKIRKIRLETIDKLNEDKLLLENKKKV